MKKITKNVALIDGGRAYVTIFDSKDWFVDNRSSIIRMTKTDKYVEDMNYIFEKKGESCDLCWLIGVDAEGKRLIIGITEKGEISPDELDCEELNRFEYYETINIGFKDVSARNITTVMKGVLRRVNMGDMFTFVRKHIRGQEKAVRVGVVAIYEYMKGIAENRKTKTNILMTGPSGSGKTEFYRVIKKFFEINMIPIPVVQVDMTTVTTNGFKGEDSNYFLKMLLAENRKMGGYGILVIDEIDKRCRTTGSECHVDYNFESMSQILTMVEGTVMEIDGNMIDTNRTMFVGVGSFQDLREENKKKKEKNTLGFSGRIDNCEAVREEIYKDLTFEDVIEYGLLAELAGRFTFILNFNKISKMEMSEIIKMNVETIKKELDVDIVMMSWAEEELIEEAYGERGVRGVINKIKQLCYEALAYNDDYINGRKIEYFNRPSIEIYSNNDAFVITKEYLMSDYSKII